jgi:hypothetical protein
MRTLLPIALLVLCAASSAFGQDHGFPFGNPGYAEFDFKVYAADTSAQAVVLDEFGEAYIDLETLDKVIFKHHIRIKILKPQGLKYADYSIALYNNNKGKEELLRSVKASSFNLRSSITETKLENSKVFTEKYSKNLTVKKFALPDVRVGTILEIAYEIESPFLFNFRTWKFQEEIPKRRSEFWATYPANYEYNVVLKGFQKLDKNESKLIKDCVGTRSTLGTTPAADCAQFKYAMNNIPAFVDEDFMVARSNYMSSINYELATVRHFTGQVNKITQEWKDAEQEMRQDTRFGTQLKKGKDIAEGLGVDDADAPATLPRAKKIYEAHKAWYQWNGEYGMLTEQGIRKAFDERKGNVADINLALVAVLRHQGFAADPVILSTRANGFVTEVHPVLSDFNYVVARVRIGETYYLLDATDDYLTFGMIPERCINGKGRVMTDKESAWIDLKPTEKSRQVTLISLTLGKDGKLTGKVQNSYAGYAAMEQRKRIRSYANENEYVTEVAEKVLKAADVKAHKLTDVDSLYKPLSEVFDIEVDGFADEQTRHHVLAPFIADRWDANPFKSPQRLYPVDFGIPIDETIIINLDLPPGVTITDLPQKVGLALPNAGGRFLFDARYTENRLTLQSNLIIARTIYSSEEYHYLKELFNSVVSAQNANIVLQR